MDGQVRGTGVPGRRQLLGTLVGLGGLPALTAALLAAGEGVDLSTALLTYLTMTMVVAAIGGIWPSLPVAVAGFTAGSWFFTTPYRTWSVQRAQDLLALAVFLTVAVVVSVLAELVARRAAEAERARAEAETLARLAVTALSSEDPLALLLDDLVRTFDLEGASVLRAEEHGWHCEARAGTAPPSTPAGADATDVAPGVVLAMRGVGPARGDRRILAAYATQLALVVQRRALEAEAAHAEVLAEGNRLRTALLSAVSHDLRTPLATIKAWLTGLLEGDVRFSDEEVAQILTVSVGEVDRLNALVGNLLDMSRLQAGAVQVASQPLALDAVASAVAAELPHGAGRLDIEIPDTLPLVQADGALLERIVANLVDNALRHSPEPAPVELRALLRGGDVELRISDHGRGIAPAERERVFEPFQRLGDSPGTSGVGLGLAVAKGLSEAVNANLTVEDTPGGGATMVLLLAAAP